MNNKSITPNPQQPVDRVPTGQLPSALAELSEAELSAGVLPSGGVKANDYDKKIEDTCWCSYDGDDE
jgi:bacteriocin leader peptide (microcyclamide/patellamide family)